MNYYVYKITDIKTGEFYIGKRQCDCDIKEDSYMGSGVKIKELIALNGESNYKKTVIAICDDPYELATIESSFIKCNIDNVLCINISKAENFKKEHYKKKIDAYEQNIEDLKNKYNQLNEEFRLYKIEQREIIKEIENEKLHYEHEVFLNSVRRRGVLENQMNQLVAEKNKFQDKYHHIKRAYERKLNINV